MQRLATRGRGVRDTVDDSSSDPTSDGLSKFAPSSSRSHLADIANRNDSAFVAPQTSLDTRDQVRFRPERLETSPPHASEASVPIEARRVDVDDDPRLASVFSEPLATTQRHRHRAARSPTKERESARGNDTSSKEGRTPGGRRKRIYCGNNKLDPRLESNGGALRIGRPSECFRKGFGGALYQHVDDEDAFIEKFNAPYEKLIAQEELWFKDTGPPEGMIRCTLPQARQRGWGAGSRELARRLSLKRQKHAH